MAETSDSRQQQQQRARELVAAYERSLEQQIVGRGSSLACRDEELWTRVEALLRDADAQETHCLGLDPLAVMEESLKAVAAAGRGGKVKARGGGGGLQGLAKAFEVLEQAALNLYLGPWRDEYKVVKMYSGMFTHHIRPVLSMPQVEQLFGLLGYEPGAARHEQLLLQTLAIGPASLDDLLRLSCAFFLARCECRLLRAALGKRGGEAQWELSAVRERQRGGGLQVALDNAKKTLKGKQAPKEPFDVDVDLYTDEHVNGRRAAATREDNPWTTQMGLSPPAAKTHGDAAASSSSSSLSCVSPTGGGHVCVSTLSCQLTKTSPPEAAVGESKGRGRRFGEGSRFDGADSRSEATGLCEGEADRFCSCLDLPHLYLKHCVECNTLHDYSCASLQSCLVIHSVVTFYDLTEGGSESGPASPQSEKSLGAGEANTSPTLVATGGSSSAAAAMSSLVLRDDSDDDPGPAAASLHPFTYHDCCDLGRLDPRVLCRSCGVFHSSSCRDADYCHVHHAVRPLGACVCGKPCSRKPLVLCRYCGNEYCRDCWYRNPVVCVCGQTFDQSSSV